MRPPGDAKGTFEFRPLREEDLPLLMEWHGRAHVMEWWPRPASLAELRRELLGEPGAPAGVSPYLAYVDGVAFGFVQSYAVRGAGDGWWPEETDPGARGIDQFIAAEENLGRGLGRAMVRAFVRELFADPAVTKVQTDPSPENARAIRCFEKAGFERVGLVETPDGRALLMVCARDQGNAAADSRGE